jgi:glutathione peroxidase
MSKTLYVMFSALVAVAIGGFIFQHHFSTPVEAKERSVLDFKMKDIDGNDVKLKKYKGNVLLVVNTASKCGYTPQYEGLESIYAKYKDQGFYVLGFPANNFGGQEPGTDSEIKEFCSLKYKVTFPMFSKISVKGDDQDPLYKFLTSKESDPDFSGDITWNFNKFLIDRKGKVVARFSSKDTPQSDAVTQAIEKYMAEK